MRREAEKDLKESEENFRNIVWPEIQNLWFDGGKLFPIEAIEKEMEKSLDTVAGIDAWCVKSDQCMLGIASRVQETDRPYNSFTVRKERKSGIPTEYEKKREAIKSDGLYPEITIQAYIKGNNLLSAGKIRTEDLINYIMSHDYIEVQRAEDEDNEWAKFFVAYWRNLETVETLECI